MRTSSPDLAFVYRAVAEWPNGVQLVRGPYQLKSAALAAAKKLKYCPKVTVEKAPLAWEVVE